jgi:hypothetical protein
MYIVLFSSTSREDLFRNSCEVYLYLISASEPFAVNRSSLLNDLVQAAKPNNQQLSDKENQQITDADEPPSKH